MLRHWLRHSATLCILHPELEDPAVSTVSPGISLYSPVVVSLYTHTHTHYMNVQYEVQLLKECFHCTHKLYSFLKLSIINCTVWNYTGYVFELHFALHPYYNLCVMALDLLTSGGRFWSLSAFVQVFLSFVMTSPSSCSPHLSLIFSVTWRDLIIVYEYFNQFPVMLSAWSL